MAKAEKLLQAMMIVTMTVIIMASIAAGMRVATSDMCKLDWVNIKTLNSDVKAMLYKNYYRCSAFSKQQYNITLNE
jgi:hypothetical protein